MDHGGLGLPDLGDRDGLVVGLLRTRLGRLVVLGNMIGDGKTRVFRFALLNSEPTGSGDTKLASLAAGLGTVENSQWFFLGKLEAQQVTPQLTDSNTATVTITLQSRFFGAFTQT
jgi:hypothetical protein